ncbi:MAG: sigma-70 family RNA polymerase sigma factor [Alphaproteobacteria bacterium]|nr:sigma-70 family RNA polymerase sigma factor [Alphaproteobacteria bacterium]
MPTPDAAGDTLSEPPPLANLLTATAAGDRRAFTMLYAQSSGQLFAVILRILKQRSWAEEVLQEAYIGIWSHAGSYAPDKGSAMAWMIAIARNRAIDVYRRERARRALDDPADPADAVAPDPSPSDFAEADDTARALRRCLEELEDKQRESILLAYRDGYTHQEIADRLESPIGTVKSWIRRGQLRLKTCLER